jgi:hypothetical protein
VGLFTPPLLESIGWATYIFYACWNIVAFFVVWKWFVETKGKSLEEIDAIFNDGAGSVDAIEKSFDHHQEVQEKVNKQSDIQTPSIISSNESNIIATTKKNDIL